jgi:hypothetical protein
MAHTTPTSHHDDSESHIRLQVARMKLVVDGEVFAGLS